MFWDEEEGKEHMSTLRKASLKRRHLSCRRVWSRQWQGFQAAGTVCAKTFHLPATPGQCESERVAHVLIIMPRK